jgi:uncharacterized paraquat-inducible protein A
MTASILTKVVCKRCDACFTLPELSSEIRTRVVELRRTDRSLEAVRVLRISGAIELADAKSIVHHITREPGVCHRCRASLPGEGQVVCPKCKALNFDW